MNIFKDLPFWEAITGLIPGPIVLFGILPKPLLMLIVLLIGLQLIWKIFVKPFLS